MSRAGGRGLSNRLVIIGDDDARTFSGLAFYLPVFIYLGESLECDGTLEDTLDVDHNVVSVFLVVHTCRSRT